MFRIGRLFTLLLFAVPLTAERFAIQTVTRSGQTIELETQGGETIDVVIELREPPLVLQRGRVATNAARQSFAALFDRLERDLARVAGPEKGRVAANAQSAPRLGHKFTVTFAGASATIPSRAFRSIAALDYVKAVHLDKTYKAMLDQSVPQIRAPEAWTQFGTRGKGVVVAIIDTGIDYRHASLGGTFGPSGRVIGGYDFVNNDADPMDDAGHGTHVAAIVGGNGGGLLGVAPEVSFLAYKVLNHQGGGTLSGILAGVERAVDPNDDGNTSDHADVVNMSLGGAGDVDDPLATAVEYGIGAGVVFCIATGNAGSFYAVSSPAVAPSAISVGALERNGTVATFSSKGPAGTRGAIKPEVSAPGVGIVSAQAGGGTAAHDGTSMATPHVAGVAALVRAVHPEWTPAEVKAAIVGSASALTEEVMAVGAGRVDAVAAISASILATPSVLGFGLTDPASSVWTSRVDVRLTNRGPAAATLDVSFDGLRDGVTLTAEPASVALASGESKTVAVTLRVENGLVPSPEEGSLAFGGRMNVTGASSQALVPWAFVKASKALLTTADDGAYYVVFATETSLRQTIVDGSLQPSAELLLPAGTYDVLVRELTPRNPAKTQIALLFEKMRIDGATTIHISPDLATLTLELEAVDENGQPLQHGGSLQCINEEFLVWPADSFVGHTSHPHRKSTLRMKPFSDRFTLLPGKECVQYASRAAYAGNFQPLVGMTGDVTRRLGAADWHASPVDLIYPNATSNVSAAIVPVFLGRGPNWTLRVGQPTKVFPVSSGRWSGTMFLTRDYVAGNGYSIYVAAISNEATGPRTFPIFESPDFRFDGERIVNTPWLNPTPTAWAVESGHAFRFGEGLIYPEAAIGDEQGHFLHGGFYSGALDDRRWQATLTTQEKLYDEAGALIDPGPRLSAVSLDKGKYRYVSTQSMNIDGIAGLATLTGEFDSRRPDGETPTLSALRLESNGVPVPSRVAPGTPLSAIFSFYDRYPLTDERGSKRRPVDPDAIQMWYRAAGAAEWKPLSIVVTAIDDGVWDVVGYVTRGTVLRADLGSITGAMRGPVELRFRAQDVDGNSFDYVLAPAFVVGSGRSRSVRH